MKSSLSLRDWINEVGEADVAKLLKVARSSVRHWRVGRYTPTTAAQRLIVKYSHGRVSYEEMIEAHAKQKLSREKSISRR